MGGEGGAPDNEAWEMIVRPKLLPLRSVTGSDHII